MIRVKFQTTHYPDMLNGHWYIDYGVDVPLSMIPYFVKIRDNKNIYHHLNLIIYEWLKDSNILYWLEISDPNHNYYEPEYFIVFKKAEDAVFFKLTWC
jgi:hypothetical protein